MARTIRILMAGLVGTMVLAGAVRQVEAQTLSVTVRLRNDAHLPDDLLDAAKSAVTDIYKQAGVHATFVDGQADLVVALLSRQTASRMGNTADTMGFAPGTETVRGTVAYVLQPRVERIAEGYSVKESVVLAAAIAHEMGHLLLPFNAHSKAGIMRADWNQADFRSAVHGELLFTAEQAAQIRSRLAGDGQAVAMVQ